MYCKNQNVELHKQEYCSYKPEYRTILIRIFYSINQSIVLYKPEYFTLYTRILYCMNHLRHSFIANPASNVLKTDIWHCPISYNEYSLLILLYSNILLLTYLYIYVPAPRASTRCPFSSKYRITANIPLTANILSYCSVINKQNLDVIQTGYSKHVILLLTKHIMQVLGGRY